MLFHDRTLVTNREEGLSTEPDGTFVSFEALKAGRVRFVKGKKGVIEIDGMPDMTLEVVSESSERKDLVTLRHLYWLAGVREYWVADARDERLKFDILARGRTEYVATPKRGGWVASKVFGKSFKLVGRKGQAGYPEYSLETR